MQVRRENADFVDPVFVVVDFAEFDDEHFYIFNGDETVQLLHRRLPPQQAQLPMAFAMHLLRRSA